jgi:RNA polymerase sigma-70 factor (ECF subfamily)
MMTEEYLYLKFCKDGDEDSLRMLIGEVNVWLHGAIFKIVADDDFADDIVQETWIKLLGCCEKFNPEQGSFINYVFTIAKRVALKEIDRHVQMHKKHKNSYDPDELNLRKERLSPEYLYLFNERSAAILNAISSLDDIYRNTIELYYYAGFSYQQIAEILTEPLGTVSSQLKRGKEELGKILPDFIKNEYIMEKNEQEEN